MPYTAFDQLREANPVPDPSNRRSREIDLAPLVESVLLESQTRNLEPVALKPSPRRPRWGLVLAASTVAAMVIGLILVTIPRSEPEVANTTPPPSVPLTPTDYTIEAYDFGFNGVPEKATVGSTLTLSNTSADEFHNLFVLQLFDDDTRTIEDFAEEPVSTYWSDDWCPEIDVDLCDGKAMPGFQVAPGDFGGTGGVGYEPYVGQLSAGPGETDAYRVGLNTTGRFLILDMVPEGVDPQVAEEAPGWPIIPGDGTLGYQQGMIAIIEVVAPEQPVVPNTPTTYTIEAFDFGFNGVPEQMTVGSALELMNSSTTEFHNLGVSKLPVEETRTVEELMALPPEAFYSDSEGIGSLKVDHYVGVIHARPGQAAYDGRIRINGPGRYLLVDLVRQGSDPAVVEAAVAEDSSPLQVPGGLVGYQQGMIAIIEVVE